MLRFESWPPEPEATFVTTGTLSEISDTFETLRHRIAVGRLVSMGIYESLVNNVDDGQMSPERAQAFYEAVAPQIPDVTDGVGAQIKEDLRVRLIGRDDV